MGRQALHRAPSRLRSIEARVDLHALVQSRAGGVWGLLGPDHEERSLAVRHDARPDHRHEPHARVVRRRVDALLGRPALPGHVTALADLGNRLWLSVAPEECAE